MSVHDTFRNGITFLYDNKFVISKGWEYAPGTSEKPASEYCFHPIDSFPEIPCNLVILFL